MRNSPTRPPAVVAEDDVAEASRALWRGIVFAFAFEVALGGLGGVVFALYLFWSV